LLVGWLALVSLDAHACARREVAWCRLVLTVNQSIMALV
jgi:hypothetical protein